MRFNCVRTGQAASKRTSIDAWFRAWHHAFCDRIGTIVE
ncbi:hypothetical protein N599_30650 [Saccharopolyspora erythraea D]|nr:hypothetical protein N599_30650 [Saccharopolyspora erythraea D]